MVLCIVALACPACDKEIKGVKEELKIIREENNFLKAENIALKKEIEELYKKVEGYESAKLNAAAKEKARSQEVEKPVKKPAKPETDRTRKPDNRTVR